MKDVRPVPMFSADWCEFRCRSRSRAAESAACRALTLSSWKVRCRDPREEEADSYVALGAARWESVPSGAPGALGTPGKVWSWMPFAVVKSGRGVCMGGLRAARRFSGMSFLKVDWEV